jgi:hypothetical protein
MGRVARNFCHKSFRLPTRNDEEPLRFFSAVDVLSNHANCRVAEERREEVEYYILGIHAATITSSVCLPRSPFPRRLELRNKLALLCSLCRTTMDTMCCAIRDRRYAMYSTQLVLLSISQ